MGGVAKRAPIQPIDPRHPQPRHIERAVEELGADRIMFGTDWAPTWRAEAGDIYRKGLAMVDALKISAEAKDWIRWRTASTLFKI